MKIGFDNALYMQKQKEHILERIARFQGKLYLDFGGKLFDDFRPTLFIFTFHDKLYWD